MNLGDTIEMKAFTAEEYEEEVDLWKEFEREQQELCRQTREVVQQGPRAPRPEKGLEVEPKEGEAKFWRKRA